MRIKYFYKVMGFLEQRENSIVYGPVHKYLIERCVFNGC